MQVSQNFSDDANHMRADVTAFVLWANNSELLGNTRYYHIPGRQFDEQILERLSHVAGIVAVSGASGTPLMTTGWAPLTLPNRPEKPAGSVWLAWMISGGRTSAALWGSSTCSPIQSAVIT